jgi:hypothetical protein
LLDRLRQAFIPRDPLYRRESGAGRRVALVFKLVGAGAVFSAYFYWSVMAHAGRDMGETPIYAVTVASLILYLVALALGVQAMRGEVTGGTAESLVLTPLDRRRIVVSKLAGSGEMLVVAALLLPLYCCTMASLRSINVTAAYAHGGPIRVLMAMGFNSYYLRGDMSGLMDILVGLGAFAADLSWFALFAAVGLWAAASRRAGAVVWLLALAVSAVLFVAIGFVEYVGLGIPPGPEPAYYYGYGYRPSFADKLLEVFDSYHDRGASWDWPIAWWLLTLAGRAVIAWLLLLLATRNFDRIATD